MNTLIDIAQQAYSATQSQHPNFGPGDTICVYLKIQEKNKERIQKFEGTVIKDRGTTVADKTFTVRKIAHGVPVYRIFPRELPNIQKIEVVREGIVRRAHLSYLRGKTGKAAKIKHKQPVSKKSVKKNKALQNNPDVATVDSPKQPS